MPIEMTPAERGLARLLFRDILALVSDYGDPGRDVIARVPFEATLDQVMGEAYGITERPPLTGSVAATDPAPWEPDEVESLNGYQASDAGHPFTCGRDECRHQTRGTPLQATADGWRCPHCGYGQDWAYAFMTDWTWRLPGAWALIVFSGTHGPRWGPGGDTSQKLRLRDKGIPGKAPPC
jgi:hypothetical protein